MAGRSQSWTARSREGHRSQGRWAQRVWLPCAHNVGASRGCGCASATLTSTSSTSGHQKGCDTATATTSRDPQSGTGSLHCSDAGRRLQRCGTALSPGLAVDQSDSTHQGHRQRLRCCRGTRLPDWVAPGRPGWALPAWGAGVVPACVPLATAVHTGPRQLPRTPRSPHPQSAG